jgi:hypothetical protein
LQQIFSRDIGGGGGWKNKEQAHRYYTSLSEISMKTINITSTPLPANKSIIWVAYREAGIVLISLHYCGETLIWTWHIKMFLIKDLINSVHFYE